MADNDAPMANRPPSNVAWLFSRLTRPERAMLVIYVAQGGFMLGMVCYRELSSGPMAGASAMAAMAVLLIGLGVWNATVSALRKP